MIKREPSSDGSLFVIQKSRKPSSFRDKESNLDVDFLFVEETEKPNQQNKGTNVNERRCHIVGEIAAQTAQEKFAGSGEVEDR